MVTESAIATFRVPLEDLDALAATVARKAIGAADALTPFQRPDKGLETR
jgi:hypothetical protein